MKGLRKVIRGLLVLATTLGCFLVLVVCLLLLLPFRGVRRRARNRILNFWGRTCLWILGGRLVVEGEPPQGQFFLVSNHVSYVDILALGASVGCFFIAKAEIRSWPLMGFISHTAGTLFIDRELRRDVARVNALVERTLEEGYGIVLFPEGTSSQGHDLLPFRSPLLAYPVSVGMAVHTASLTYSTPPGEVPANLSICWWGDAPFGGHAWQLLGLKSFEARVRFGESVPAGDERKALARRLQDEVESIFVPIVAPHEAAEDHGF